MNERITIDTPDGSFAAYVAYPDVARAPSVVVLQEIFGINADMRAHCDRLAKAGYIAVCPDLFWRLEPGVELTDKTEAEWTRARELRAALDIDKAIEDIEMTIARAGSFTKANGKVGVMGFCLGGLLSFLSAARLGPDAAVAYYGGGTDKKVAEFAELTSPLILHLGEADEYIGPEARAQIAVAAEGKAHVYLYPGQHHAFARKGGKHYDQDAATLAYARTLAFFADHLQ